MDADAYRQDALKELARRELARRSQAAVEPQPLSGTELHHSERAGELSPVEKIVKPFKAQTFQAAKSFNESLASFSKSLDDLTRYAEERTGIKGRGGAFAQAARFYADNADYWDKKVKEVGPSKVDEIIGSAVGSAVPGIAEFMLNAPWAALKGASEAHDKGSSELAGAAKGATERVLMGKALAVTQPLKPISRAVVQGGTFGADAAAKGEDPAAAAGTGVLYALAGGKGEVGLKDLAGSAVARGESGRSSDIAIHNSLQEQAAAELERRAEDRKREERARVIEALKGAARGKWDAAENEAAIVADGPHAEARADIDGAKLKAKLAELQEEPSPPVEEARVEEAKSETKEPVEKPLPALEVPQPRPANGWVWFKGQQLPFVSWREITAGKNAGKVAVVLRGVERVFDKQNVARWPQEPEAEKPAEVMEPEPVEAAVKETPKPPETGVASARQSEPTLKWGEHIGGSRYDRANGRLTVDDLSDMNERERDKFVTKKNVWHDIDYAKLVEDGVPAEVALHVKKIKDAIPIKPQSAADHEAYIREVSRVRDIVENVRTADDLKGLWDKVFPPEHFDRQAMRGAQWSENGRKVARILGGKFVREVQVSDYDLRRSKANNDRTGWPAKQEAWRQGVTIRQAYGGKWDIDRRVPGQKYRFNRLAGGFESKEAAERHLVEVLKPDLIAQRQAAGRIERPVLEHVERTLPKDHRKGKNATPDDLRETFGFRGVESGKWNVADLQTYVNQAYDALHDLADILGVPPKAISLNGELGLAFGARGGGSASAHYEPTKVVINLTKTRGDGAFAHEWGHALDDYFGRMAEKKAYPKSYASHGNTVGLRDEVGQAWAEINKTIRASKEYMRGSSAMSKSEDSYWTRPHELFARAFEAYVQDRTHEKGKSDYLVHDADNSRWSGRPYPEGAERESIDAAIDSFVKALKHRATEKGVQLYSGFAFLEPAIAKATRSVKDSVSLLKDIERETPKQRLAGLKRTATDVVPETIRRLASLVSDYSGMKVFRESPAGQVAMECVNAVETSAKADSGRWRSVHEKAVADLGVGSKVLGMKLKAPSMRLSEPAWIKANFKRAYEAGEKMPSANIQAFADAWTKIQNEVGAKTEKLKVLVSDPRARESYDVEAVAKALGLSAKSISTEDRIVKDEIQEGGNLSKKKLAEALGVRTADVQTPQRIVEFINEHNGNNMLKQSDIYIPSGKRPFKMSMRETFFPRMLTSEAREAFDKGEGPLYEAMLKAGATDRHSDGADLSTDENWMTAERARRAASLEAARLGFLPDKVTLPSGEVVKVLEDNPFIVIPKYIESSAQRLAIVEHMGQADAQEYADEIYEALKGEGHETEADIWLDMWSTLNGRYNEKEREFLRKHRLGGFVSGMENIARTAMLSTSTLSQLSGPVPIAVRAGALNALKQTLRLAAEAPMRRLGANLKTTAELEFVRDLGGFSRDTLGHTFETEDLSGKIGKAGDALLRATGFELSNRKLNQLASLAAIENFCDGIAYLRKPNDRFARRLWGKDAASVWRQLKDNYDFSDDQIDRMVDNGIDYADFRTIDRLASTDRKFAQAYLDLAQTVQKFSGKTNLYNESVLNRPAWMSKRVPRMVLAFTSYARAMGRTRNIALREASRGNLRPIVTLLVGGALGSVPVDELRKLIFRKDGTVIQDKMDAFYYLANRELDSATLGMVGNFGQDLMWDVRKGNIGIDVPMWDWWSRNVLGIVKAVDKGEPVRAYKAFAKSTPLVRAIDAQMEGPLYRNRKKR